MFGLLKSFEFRRVDGFHYNRFRSSIPKGRHSERSHSWSLHGIVLDIATTRRLTLTLTVSLTVSCHCWKWL